MACPHAIGGNLWHASGHGVWRQEAASRGPFRHRGAVVVGTPYLVPVRWSQPIVYQEHRTKIRLSTVHVPGLGRWRTDHPHPRLHQTIPTSCHLHCTPDYSVQKKHPSSPSKKAKGAGDSYKPKIVGACGQGPACLVNASVIVVNAPLLIRLSPLRDSRLSPLRDT